MKKILSRWKKPQTLIEHLEKMGLHTLDEQAEYLGVSKSHLSYFKNGKRRFGPTTAERIHRLTEVPYRHLTALQERSQ